MAEHDLHGDEAFRLRIYAVVDGAHIHTVLPGGDNRVPVADPLARLGLRLKQARNALIVQLDALKIVNYGRINFFWIRGVSSAREENGSPPQIVP